MDRLRAHPELLEPQSWHITTLQAPSQQALHDIPRLDTSPNKLRTSISESLLSQFIQDPKSATFIENYFSHGGIGDKVISLRHAFALARHFPDRIIYIDDESVLPLQNLDFPSNIRTLQSSNPISDRNKLLLAGLTVYDEGASPAATSAPDYAVMRMIKQAGADINSDLYYRSILSISPEQLREKPVISDLLIIPDALEMQHVTSSEFRSRKSLSSKRWEQVFLQLDPTMNISIVIGVSHPEYCLRVVAAAHRAGLQHVAVVKGSLDDVVHAEFSTKKIVGMDSGTTHIAAEVVKAAQAAGRSIEFRELFNEGIASFENYGIAGNQFATLVHLSSDSDLDSTDSQVVADFIKS